MRAFWKLPVFVLWSLTASCAPPSQAPPVVAASATAVEIRKAPLDDRDYRYFELDNGMKALVVSDPDTDMAAAALDVHVGQFSDPADRNGLAHFLEHMLFLGTDAYPDVDAYRDFVQSHGGGTNAGTGQQHTRYHFDIEHAHLQGALDRFSAFFVSPRLDQEYVTREREAVNSEYRLKIQSELRRFREVRRATSNPAHGFSKFSVGNLDTLGDRPDDAVWNDLRAFYDSEYSASRMAVSVVGREDLDTLEGWVRERFSQVPTTGEGPPENAAPIYLPEQVGVRINVKPMAELNELYIEFQVPPELDTYTERPVDLITSLMGQEGPGSPHDVLSSKGWITRLSTDSSGAEDHGLVTVDLTLTPLGLVHVDEAAGILFQYIRLLRGHDDLEPWWQEKKRLSQLNFEFAEPSRAAGVARGSARALQVVPPEQALSHWATWGDYNPTIVAEHLALLTPENARVFVTSPGVTTDQVEPLYNVPWSMNPLDPALVETWKTAPIDPGLALPPENPFVPESIDLVDGAAEDAVPVVVVDDPGLRVWHLADTSFNVPRAMVAATLHLPAARSSLADKVNMRLWIDLLDESLSSQLDQARVAGLSPFFNRHRDGLYIEVRGYDDKIDDVLAELLRAAVTVEVDPAVFAIHRDDRIRRYRNTPTDRPIDQTGWALAEALDPTDWNFLDAAAHLESLTAEDLTEWRAGVFAELYVEALVHGNLTVEEATAMGRSLHGTFPDAEAVGLSPVVLRRVPVGRELMREVKVDHDDSAIQVLFQGDDTSLQAQARWLMLGTLTKTPAFTQLRTEQQLGYVVWSRYDRRDMIPGLTVNIQSGVAHPEKLLERIDAFLDGMHAHLDEMTDETYETVKQGLIAGLEEAPPNLNGRTRDLSRDLALGVTSFDRKAQLVALLRELSKHDVLALLDSDVLGEDARRYVVFAVGHSHAEVESNITGCPDTACVVAKMDGAFERPR